MDTEFRVELGAPATTDTTPLVEGQPAIVAAQDGQQEGGQIVLRQRAVAESVHAINSFLSEPHISGGPKNKMVLNEFGLPLAEKISKALEALVEKTRELGACSALELFVRPDAVEFSMPSSGRAKQRIRISYHAEKDGSHLLFSKTTSDGEGGNKYYLDGEFHVLVELDRTGNITALLAISPQIITKMIGTNGILASKYAFRKSVFRSDDEQEILKAALPQLAIDMDSAIAELYSRAGINS